MMYDELIKWLRETPSIPVDAKLHNEAADAIEGLQKCVDGLESDNDKLCERIKDLSKWIPVTERLPDFEGSILCMRKSYIHPGMRHQEIMYVDEHGFRNADDVYAESGNVTHWMRLPKPPEDGEQ